MTTVRGGSAAATRRALLNAAAALLDCGGPEAVTLREVGARAGVSRGAPYRHFPDKESLLTAVAAESWERLADALHVIRDNTDEPRMQARTALMALIDIGRTHPDLYRMMFSTPTGDPNAAVRAASRAHEEFLAIVAGFVEPADAQRYGALLFTSAHGIAGLELSGHLTADKWHTAAEELVDTLVTLIGAGSGGEENRREG